MGEMNIVSSIRFWTGKRLIGRPVLERKDNIKTDLTE
jgi:hypothetical protein